MRFIKMTGGLGNQMFIYAFYMRMKKHYSNTRIDLSDMVHYKAHNGYEMHRVFLFHMIKSISGLYYISRVSISRNVFLPTWQTIYARLLHSIRACPTRKQRKCPNRQTMMRMRFLYMYAGEITWNPNIGKQPAVYANCLITSTPQPK